MQNYDDFSSLQKFIITGHNGTGKIAILRHTKYTAEINGYKAEFIVFKSEILCEAELLQSDSPAVTGSVIGEDNLKITKFYYNSIKIIVVSLFISKLKANDNPVINDDNRQDLGRVDKRSMRSS
ncbi:hypothetical protein JK191_02855 [Gluconobacter sphaericus]|uniref:hypothetical protein n=1 Tax=Gluconobacter sphaericus TaxID=574987 RepID=UPI001B8A8D8C|nr:hypothetical protein [Gluconobacter sphaericus]MBS1096524.1 hypothetical protein [Gluconobacter sphaericus]